MGEKLTEQTLVTSATAAMGTFYIYMVDTAEGDPADRGKTALLSEVFKEIDLDDVPYDNGTSGLTATDAQAAIDEVAASSGGSASTTTFSNTTSGLTATDVQAAIDEIDALLDSESHTHANSAVLDALASAGSGSVITAGERATVAAITDTGSGIVISAAERSKLSAIEAGATADQVASEVTVSPAVNAQVDVQGSLEDHETRIDAIQTKIDGIEAGATADQIASEVTVTPSGNMVSTDVQSALEEHQGNIDALTSGGVSFSDDIPVAADDGSGSAGVALEASRGDHKHPVQTSLVTTYDNTTSGLTAANVKAAIDELAADSHTHANTAVLDALTNAGSGAVITAGERTNLHTHANSAVLDALTDAGSGIIISVAERAKLTAIESGATADQSASEVAYTPYLTISSTDVQAAVNELKDELDAVVSGGITYEDDVPVAADDGTGAAGVAAEASRGDHKHPAQTAANTPIDAYTGISATTVQGALEEHQDNIDGFAATNTRVLDTIGDIAGMGAPPDGTLIHIMGYGSVGDGGGSVFRYVSSGRTGYTMDQGFYHAGPGADDFLEKVDRTIANVKMFGAVGDGVADDTAAIQAALDAGAKDVYVPEGTYLVDSGLTIASNTHLHASAATFDATSAQAIAIDGTVDATSDLYAAAGRGNITIQVATKSTFSVDDWCIVQDSPDVGVDNNDTKGTPQEMFQVVAVNTGPGDHDVITLSGALAFDYTLGATIKARAHRVTPKQNIRVEIGELQNVKLQVTVARLCELSVKSTEIGLAVQADDTATVACDRMRLKAVMEYGVNAGPTSVGLKIVGWSNSYFDIVSYGAVDDSTRLVGCANVDALAAIDSAGDRSFWCYRCTGKARPWLSNCPAVGTGNIENILLDYCEDFVLDNPRVVGWRDGDAIEIRGRARNVAVRDLYIVEDGGGLTTTALNLHGTGNAFECEIRGGHITGSGSDCFVVRENVDSVYVDGLTIEPHPDDATFTAVRLGENMNTFGDQDNITLRNCKFFSAGARAMLINDEDGVGNVLNNLVIDNVEVGFATGTAGSILLIQDTVDSVIRGIKYTSAATARDFDFKDNTRLLVDDESFDLGTNGDWDFATESGNDLKRPLSFVENYGSAASAPTIHLNVYKNVKIDLDVNNYAPAFTAPSVDQEGYIRFDNASTHVVAWHNATGVTAVSGSAQPLASGVSIIKYVYDLEADTIHIF